MSARELSWRRRTARFASETARASRPNETRTQLITGFGGGRDESTASPNSSEMEKEGTAETSARMATMQYRNATFASAVSETESGCSCS